MSRLLGTYAYWVEHGRLMAGAHPRDDAHALAVDHAITDFFDLTRPGEGVEPYDRDLPAGSRRHAHPIPDLDVPTAASMRAILDALDVVITGGGVAYVHCRAGIGRTGTVVGCRLRDQGQTATEALATIATLRRGLLYEDYRSPEMDVQVGMVRDWH